LEGSRAKRVDLTDQKAGWQTLTGHIMRLDHASKES